MTLSLNEIRSRAVAFKKEWAGKGYEKGHTQTFYNDLFTVFGLTKRAYAYEQSIALLNGDRGFIDLFWPGTLLVEQKSKGRDLAKARTQALGYFNSLKNAEKPRFILLSDFQTFELMNLETGEEAHFALADLDSNIHHLLFLAGYETHSFKDEASVNVNAAKLLGGIHNRLAEAGYRGHDLEVLLVRLLFCMFADDTGIFPKDSFAFFLKHRTHEDGSDLGGKLASLFQTLNKPTDRRSPHLDELLATMPYVNGKLFAEAIELADFDRAMREQLLECCGFNWAEISPAIFGSLFQGTLNEDEQHDHGAHYTSERNIMKVIKDLFLDDLRAEFAKIRNTAKPLQTFHQKLGQLKFLDPACGSGNFLILAYRALRELEIDVLQALYPSNNRQGLLDISTHTRVQPEQFYGIELFEFPAHIAQVAMWLVDHQMNVKLAETFGQYFVRLPLGKSAQVSFGTSALQVDWNTVVPAGELTYILGNPPFLGSKRMTDGQRAEVMALFPNGAGAGVLDYVCGWYAKAADYMQANTAIQAAFVSTNSITQGEQVAVLWGSLFSRYGLKLHFAHRTFKWSNRVDLGDGHGGGGQQAAVFVVIVGFGLAAWNKTSLLYDYPDIAKEPVSREVKNLTPYLSDGPNTLIEKTRVPLCAVPPIGIGNKPIDGGNYLFTTDEKAEFIKQEPLAAQFFHPWIGAEEFLYSKERWCLWLGDCPPEALRKMPHALKRVEAVRQLRLASSAPSTQALASTPTRFHVENMPDGNFLVMPEVTSERREYIPIAFMAPPTLASNLVSIISDATLFHFGVLTSAMHMAWVRAVAGRLKSDYRYSNQLCYNPFPWPTSKPDQKKKIEAAAQAVLDARAAYPGSTLADLYDPRAMPADLRKAHQVLDKAVDAAYRSQPFTTEAARLEHLLGLYQQLVSPLAAEAKPSKNKRRVSR